MENQQIYEGTINKIETSDQEQTIELELTTGPEKGQIIKIITNSLPSINNPSYQIKSQLMVSKIQSVTGQDFYNIVDIVRRDPLLLLFIIFMGLSILVAKTKGIASLIGMILSFFIIFTFVLPKISDGYNPILISILGSLFMIPSTFFISHGLNKKTIIAVMSTLFSLIVTGILANYFIEATQLTGFASEEAGFLQFMKGGSINMKGLLLAGIIIGLLGILDDITIAQASIVFQLKQANKKLRNWKLYNMAMEVGKDHISSLVNTLIMVYTGASLPLLLLFINNPQPFAMVINYEFIADEIVRTLVGSIGLILAIPITTFIATYFSEK